MTTAQTPSTDPLAALHAAAIRLATYVDHDDRRTNDPNTPGERGPRADALRAVYRDEALADFRAATAALRESFA